MARRNVAVAIDIGSAYRHHIDIYAGIHRFAREHAGWEYELDPFASGGPRKGRGSYDGIIARATQPIVGQAARRGVPLVNVWAASPVAGSLPTVMADYAACGRIAAEHFLSRGYRRFGFQGIRRNLGSQLAWKAFSEVIEQAGSSCTTIAISPTCNETSAAWDRYLAQVDAWIASWKPPLGIFVVQDIFSRFLVNACRRNGLRSPEDVALISFGNEPLLCGEPEPSLSSIDAGF